MGMDLRRRHTIRPPKRYEGEASIQPTRPPPPPEPRVYMPRGARPSIRPPFIEYNPNLPPAAFPTLDAPQPSQQHTREPNGISANNASINGIGGGQEQQVWNGNTVILSRQGRNGVARNGPQIDGEDAQMLDCDEEVGFDDNIPQYYKDEAPLGDADFGKSVAWSRDEFDDPVDVSGEGPDLGIETSRAAGIGAKDFRPIKWHDISPVLQTEIFENLRSKYDSRLAIELLRLKPDEQAEMVEHSTTRQQQIQTENEQLKEMRRKQLRALLRLDNGSLQQHKVPAQLVFRNISKRYLRNTLSRPEADYCMTRAADLLIARKYLSSIGLGPSLAGEWGNNLVKMRRDSAGVDEEFEWTGQSPLLEEGDVSDGYDYGETDYESSLASEETAHDDSSQSDSSPGAGPSRQRDRASGRRLNAAQQILRHRKELSSGRHGPPINRPPSTGWSLGHATKPGAPPTQSSSLSFAFVPQPPRQQSPPPRGGRVIRLKVGPQGAAQIQGRPLLEKIVIPPTPAPPRLDNISHTAPKTPTEAVDMANRERHGHPPPSTPPGTGRSKSGRSRDSGPLPRSLGGAWCWGTTMEAAELASRDARNLQAKLKAARAEMEKQRQASSAAADPMQASSSTALPVPGHNHAFGLTEDGLCKCQFQHAAQPEPAAEQPAEPVGVPDWDGPSTLEHFIASNSVGLPDLPIDEENGPAYSPITPTRDDTPAWLKPRGSEEDFREDSPGIPPLVISPTPTPSANGREAEHTIGAAVSSSSSNPQVPVSKQNSVSPVAPLEVVENHIQASSDPSSNQETLPPGVAKDATENSFPTNVDDDMILVGDAGEAMETDTEHEDYKRGSPLLPGIAAYATDNPNPPIQEQEMTGMDETTVDTRTDTEEDRSNSTPLLPDISTDPTESIVSPDPELASEQQTLMPPAPIESTGNPFSPVPDLEMNGIDEVNSRRNLDTEQNNHNSASPAPADPPTPANVERATTPAPKAVKKNYKKGGRNSARKPAKKHAKKPAEKPPAIPPARLAKPAKPTKKAAKKEVEKAEVPAPNVESPQPKNGGRRKSERISARFQTPT
ncbi:hypothetical protein FQN52_003583 [Onygenales sp. PD_12]|nr:hypothetical protein FQN52_003583 [Onygenales sp. PD_12]